MAHSEEDIRRIVSELTLEEKCGLLSGGDFWHTKPVERLGIPAVMVSDGPHGLRTQSDQEGSGVNDSLEAVCFPAACAGASSFDRELWRLLGQTLGEECQARNVSTLLGPAINIKRSPLCGRNFEYVSEDPLVAGELAAAYVEGVQSKGVGTSLKHFALNNQEYRRLTNSSDCDGRTMREIYLAAFETVVKRSQPATIMHSYNKINGTYAGESTWLLTDVLRTEWGFRGVVMSDWGAVSDRVAGVRAGGDLEMPASHGINDAKVLQAARTDSALVERIDQSCRRILRWVYGFVDGRQAADFDFAAHHRIARRIAQESIVLLKNEAGALPLPPQGKIACIGEFAAKPRFQGGGSSHIRTVTVDDALTALKAAGADITYARGFAAAPEKDAADTAALAAEAMEAARAADRIVVFAGLPDSFESEGYDRSHMDLPEEQDRIIAALCTLGKPVIVVLHNGSPVTMPWADSVQGIIEAYLGGEAVGAATADVLLGTVNPSGHLAETFPLRLEDTPSFLDFSADKAHTAYTEGVFVGYRWYDARRMDVRFPFGHGLSYTTFAYSDLRLSADTVEDGGTVRATVTVRNTGSRDGKEVVQLYVADLTGSTRRPPKELKGFEKVFLRAGEACDVTFELGMRSFSWYSTELGGWYAAPGDYEICVGASSRDIRCTAPVRLATTARLPLEVCDDTPLGDLLADERTAPFITRILEETASPIDSGNEAASEAITPQMMARMQDSNPLRNVHTWNNLSQERYDRLLADLRAALAH